MFKIWYSDEEFGNFVVENTILSEVQGLEWSKL
jgi:hypothetical protein